MEALLQVMKENGITAAIAIYLIYQTRKDYNAVCRRLNEVEDYIKNTLVGLVKDTTKAIERNADAIEDCERK